MLVLSLIYLVKMMLARQGCPDEDGHIICRVTFAYAAINSTLRCRIVKHDSIDTLYLNSSAVVLKILLEIFVEPR